MLFSKVHEIPQIKIFRFESPIIYFNADYFRESLLDAVGIDLKSGQKRTIHPKEFNENHLNLRNLIYIIIDCSSINQLDYSGGKIFLQTIKELNDCQFKVYLCNLRCKKFDEEKTKREDGYFFVDYNYDLLEKLDMDRVCSVNVMATVHDAVHKIQDESIENNEQVGL